MKPNIGDVVKIRPSSDEIGLIISYTNNKKLYKILWLNDNSSYFYTKNEIIYSINDNRWKHYPCKKKINQKLVI